MVKNIFVLNTCTDIVGADVRCFQNERDLLKDWEKFIQDYDPDFILGYNHINFDLPYILDRAKALKLKNYGYFGKLKNSISKVRDARYMSKAMGMRDTKEIKM